MKKSIVFITALLLSTLNLKSQTQWKWANGHSPTSIEWEGNTLAIDKSRNVYQAGWSAGGGPDSMYFDGIGLYVTNLHTSMAITALDSTGHYKYAVVSDSTACMPFSIAPDALGNLFVYGWWGSTTFIVDTVRMTKGPGIADYFLMKLAPTGRALWARTITRMTGVMTGGMGMDGAGNLYVCGTFKQNFSMGTDALVNSSGSLDSTDIFIAKLDANGNPIWARRFVGLNSDYIYQVRVTDAGNIYLTGYTNSPTMTAGAQTITGFASYVVKYDSAGNCLWARRMSARTYANALTTDALENVYLTGFFDSTTTLGATSVTAINADPFVAKYDAQGNFRWIKTATGAGNDVGFGIAVDGCGKVWVSGGMQNPMSAIIATPGYKLAFGVGDSLVSAPCVGGAYRDPMFIACYDTAGTYMNSMSVGSGGDDWSEIVTDSHQNFYVGGDVEYDVAFGNDTLNNSGAGEGLFVAKYKYDSVGCDPTFIEPLPSVAEPFAMYPNPANGQVTINCGSSTLIKIYDLQGRQVYSLAVDKSVVVDISPLVPGNYLVVLVDNHGISKSKLLTKE